MIVAGTLTNKMAPALRKVYDQMPGASGARTQQQEQQRQLQQGLTCWLRSARPTFLSSRAVAYILL
jgi:hypothetical protein